MASSKETRLDLMRCWTQATAMLRADRDIVLAVAGMFIFLPTLAILAALPDPTLPTGQHVTPEQMSKMISDYMEAHAWLLLARVPVVAFGSLLIAALYVGEDRPDVARAAKIALVALPAYLVAYVVQSLVVSTGYWLLFLPGIYLAGRMMCIIPAAVARRPTGALAIVTKSWRATGGAGLQLMLFLIVCALVGIVAFILVALFVGAFAYSLLPADVARLLVLAGAAAVLAGYEVAVLMMGVAIYRARQTQG